MKFFRVFTLLAFISSGKSETYLDEILYFTSGNAEEIGDLVEELNSNIPVKDVWAKDTEYKALVSEYKKSQFPKSRIYKIKIPIKIEKNCSSGVCYDVEKEELIFKKIDSFLKGKIYLSASKRISGYSMSYDYSCKCYRTDYKFLPFRGKAKHSIPRDYFKENFDKLTLDAYVRFDIKNLAFNPGYPPIEVFDIILSDANGNVALSTNYSYLSSKGNVSEEHNDNIPITNSKYKKNKALQPVTAKNMSVIVSALEKEDMNTVIRTLNLLTNNIDSLKSYDRAVVYNTWGSFYFKQGAYQSSINSYVKVIREQGVTSPMRNAALFTLAQLYLIEKNYKKSINMMTVWMNSVEKTTAQSWSILGKTYFLDGNYQSSLESLKSAVLYANEEGYRLPEVNYILLASLIRKSKNKLSTNEYINQLLDINQLTREDIILAGLDQSDLPGVNIEELEIFIKEIEPEKLIIVSNESNKEEKLLYDGEYIPLFKVQPIYPRRAQERGIEGKAIVSFTITELGTVENVKNLEGYCGDPQRPEEEMRPCTIFNSASATAASQFKYRPKIVDGKATIVEGVTHMFTFMMADEG